MTTSGYRPYPSQWHIRASDADRERVAGILNRHYAEGRLGEDELSVRLDWALAATTLGDLARLTADLPPEPPAPHPSRRNGHRAVAGTAIGATSFLAGLPIVLAETGHPFLAIAVTVVMVATVLAIVTTVVPIVALAVGTAALVRWLTRPRPPQPSHGWPA